MTPPVQETPQKVGTCGCGRSPTGLCIGWHALSEDEYTQALAEHQTKYQPADNEGSEV